MWYCTSNTLSFSTSSATSLLRAMSHKSLATCTFIVLVLLIPLIFSESLAPFRINPETRLILDKYNRTSFFHGQNVVYKEAPFIPRMDRFNTNDSFVEKDALLWKEWGFNVARLYVAWQGVHPNNPHTADYNYIEQLKRLVDLMHKHDIQVILDLHQDLMTPYLCGEGMPDHVALKSIEHPEKSSFPAPLFWLHKVRTDARTGYRLIEDCLKNPFFQYYLSKDVGRLFQDLYENKNGMMDDLAQFWGIVAKEFASSNLLGFELLNEPWAGDIYSHPMQILQSGLVDEKYLAPMYERLHEAIRKSDESTLIFYEPMVSDVKRLGFSTPPGGAQYADRTVLSYHIYCAYQDGHGDPKSRYFCDLFDGTIFQWRKEEHRRIGGGVMLTEFGALSNSTSGVDEIGWITHEAESGFQGWIHWQYKFYSDITTQSDPPSVESLFDDDGEIRVEKVRALSRTYVQYVCGDPVSNYFEPRTSAYQFVFTARTNCGGAPTVLFLNEEFYYQNGYTLNISPPDAMRIAKTEKNYVTLEASDHLAAGTKVTINVVKK